MRQLNDSELGILTFDDSAYSNVWILERKAEFNGQQIPIKIRPENKETLAISEVQRQAAKIALNLPADTLLLSAPEVIQNYECYEEDLEEIDRVDLIDPINIWNAVEPSYISVPAHSFPPYYDVKIPTFILYAECTWDSEHGLEVRFRNGYADESDQQGHLSVKID